MKGFFWTFSLLVFCGTLFAQDELKVIKPVAPANYPPAARAVRASGDVSVQVEVDPQGKVVTAKAFSGHPLLRAASESAAVQWQFSEVSKESPVRLTLLTFRYETGGTTRIEESEKSEETVFRKLFPTMFSAEVSSDSLVPRLLLLPREKGITKPKYCDLHKELMCVEIQRVDCGTRDARPELFERSEDYNDAEDKDFPNASTEDMNHCDNLIERQEVHFCSSCRIARSNWIQINR